MGLFDKLKKPAEETVGDTVAENVVQPMKKPIGTAEIKKAYKTLLDYKKGKTNLEQRIVDNEQWYKLRHWECMRDTTKDVQPTSACEVSSPALYSVHSCFVHLRYMLPRASKNT